MIGWQAPTQGWACLNMDGSVMLSQGSAAARGVLRSDEGLFIDSAATIALLQGDQTLHPHHTLVNSIKRQLKQQWEVHIMHVFREGNYVADYLASVGHSIPVGIQIVEITSSMLNH
ncbi:unnamed protein product [Linum trigynum]|uniref:RNase H type-1 domain-containing protein n=1 Tax=Linum trigynum TaxID=586398 RepID=A0AAV2E9Z5_9ROSI